MLTQKITPNAGLRQKGRIIAGSRKRIAEEINNYQPSMLLLKNGSYCAEVTTDLFFQLVKERGTNMRRIPWQVTVPRCGWVVLVPRQLKGAR
jgi:hypothetical protein